MVVLIDELVHPASMAGRARAAAGRERGRRRWPPAIPAGWYGLRGAAVLPFGGMTSERARVRCRERIEKLAGSTLDSVSLRREAIADLKRTIGFDRWCVPLVDPDTLIAYAGVAETDHIADLDRLQLYDASLAEANNGVAVARRRDRVGLLSRVTAGDLARSRRAAGSAHDAGGPVSRPAPPRSGMIARLAGIGPRPARTR
jgi:hypothetical protein